ncbi:ras-domain-containing protein [Ceratobasidium sp. AG-I]|nr:ras-domain-containing protein [Ceratobasidium sp. AG-I]
MSTPRTLKVVIIGDSGTGKTTLRNQYITGRFSAAYRATIGADFISKKIPHYSNPEESVLLQIWDTAGQERFSALSTAFFRGADAAILMFDATQPDSLASLRRWWDEFIIRCPVPEGTEADFCAIFVGNKIDLQMPAPHPVQPNDNGHANGGAKGVTDQSAKQFLDELIPMPRAPSPTAESATKRRTIYMDGDSLISAAESDDNVTTPTTRTQPTNIPFASHSPPDEIEPESPPRARSIGTPSRSNSSPRTPWALARSKSRGRGGGRDGAGTATTSHTMYHTPATSLFRTATNSPARAGSQDALRRGGSSVVSMQTARSNFSVSSPTAIPTSKRQSRASVTSATSELTIRPNKSLDSVPPNPSTDALTTQTQTSTTVPEIGPRLFWTSARTGDGVAPVFEYIARRVVQRWEWEESRLGYDDGAGGWDGSGEEVGPTALRLRGDWGRGRKGWKAACC